MKLQPHPSELVADPGSRYFVIATSIKAYSIVYPIQSANAFSHYVAKTG